MRSDKAGYDVLGANRELGHGAGSARTPATIACVMRSRPCNFEYDFVLIDSRIAEHAHAQRPVQRARRGRAGEYFALEGLSDLVNADVEQLHANLNPDLDIIGLLRVMFDPRITCSGRSANSSRRTSATRCSTP